MTFGERGEGVGKANGGALFFTYCYDSVRRRELTHSQQEMAQGITSIVNDITTSFEPIKGVNEVRFLHTHFSHERVQTELTYDASGTIFFD